MADDEKTGIPMLPLNGKEMGRFRRNAPAALARRTKAYFGEQLGTIASHFLTAAISLVGLLALGWSPPAMVVFFLVTIWTGTFCDVVKFALVRRAVQRLADTWNDDTHAWAVANALQAGKTEIRADNAGQYAPGAGIFVDLVFGGVATAAMIGALASANVDFITPFREDAVLRLMLFATVMIQVIPTALAIVHHAGGSGEGTPLKFAAGGRGLGLFLLLFLFVFLGPGNPTWFVIVANGALVLLGALGVFGLWLMHRETDWLRRYLQAPRAE